MQDEKPLPPPTVEEVAADIDWASMERRLAESIFRSVSVLLAPLVEAKRRQVLIADGMDPILAEALAGLGGASDL